MKICSLLPLLFFNFSACSNLNEFQRNMPEIGKALDEVNTHLETWVASKAQTSEENNGQTLSEEIAQEY